MKNDKRVAVVTGGNRGIGFQVCRELGSRGYKVILTARNEEKGEAAAKKLREEGLDVDFFRVDVTRDEDAARLRDFMEKEFERADVLVNNAGVFLDGGGFGSSASALDTDLDTVRKTMETNLYGAFRMCRALIPLMKKNRYGRVVNVSSGLGALHRMAGGYLAYRLSKTAINALTRVLASELAGTGILVNSADPGWVRTDMGGPSAHRSVEEGADTIVWLATLPDGGPTGGFFKDRRPAEW